MKSNTPARKASPALVTYNSTDELIRLLKTDYTVTIDDVCRLLSCDRRTVTRYIRPFVPHVYAKYTSSDTGLKRALPKNIYYHKTQLLCYIYDHTTFTQQIKAVPLDFCIDKNCQNAHLINSLANAYHQTRDASAYRDLMKECLASATVLGEACIKSKKGDIYRRSATPHTIRHIDKQIFMESHIRKIDPTELVYREIFEAGGVKCKIQLPDTSGAKSQMIRYISDPDPIESFDADSSVCTGLTLLVSYREWIQFIS